MRDERPGPDSGSPAESVDLELFDRTRALEYVGAPECLREVARIFLATDSSVLARLQDGLRRRDGADLEREAHGLKGALGVLGSSMAAHRAAALEEAARRGEWTQCEESMTQLTAAIVALRPVLIEISRRPNSGTDVEPPGPRSA